MATTKRNNELEIFAFNVNGLSKRYEYGFNESCLENYDLVLLFKTMVSNESDLPFQLSRHDTRFIPAEEGHKGFLFGCKRESNFEYEFVPVSDKTVIRVSLKNISNSKKTYIIPVYFEPSTWEEDFKKLEEILSEYKNESCILIGDFNARVGNQQILNEIPQFLNIIININRNAQDQEVDPKGRKLIGLCKKYRLTLLNGRTVGDVEGRFTFQSSSGSSTIDFCFVRGNVQKHVTKFEVMEEEWESDHYPITASIKFPIPASFPVPKIRFTDILRVSIGLSKGNELEKSLELFKKYRSQVSCKSYLEIILKKFADLSENKSFWDIARDLDNENVKLETPVFVQNIETLLNEVIQNKLDDFQHPSKDIEALLSENVNREEIEDISKKDHLLPIMFKEVTVKSLEGLATFYNEFINSNTGKFDCPTSDEGKNTRNSEHLTPYVVKYLFIRIVESRCYGWVLRTNMTHEYIFSCISAVPSELSTIATSYLDNKKLLYAFYVKFDNVDLFDGEEALFLKMRILGFPSKFLSAMKRIGYGEEMRKLNQRIFNISVANLQDFLPGGIIWEEENIKFVLHEYKHVILAETPTMMKAMIDKLEQYCDIWNIKVNIKQSKIICYKTSGKSAKYEKWSYGSKEIASVAKKCF